MCLPLFKKEMRACAPLALLFAGVLTLYTVMIVSMFDPALGESLEQMAAAMPELFAAFGMAHAGTTLLEFLTNYLYGFLYIVFPLVLTILLVRRLLTRYSDTGAMAWLMASPQPRLRLAATQAAQIVCWLVLLVVYLIALCIGAAQGFFPGELEVLPFLRVNVGLLGLLLLLASVCWLGACLFEGGLALGSGSGLCVMFVLLDMLAGVGEKTEFLRYATPLTLLDTAGLAAGTSRAWAAAASLYLLALACFLAGGLAFARRDWR